MNFHEIRLIIGHIKKHLKCPVCQSHFRDDDIEIIGSLPDEQTFFHALCPSCNLASVLHVCLEMDAQGYLVPQFKKLGIAPRMGKISANEVLDMQNFLKGFDGDFMKHFTKDKKQS